MSPYRETTDYEEVRRRVDAAYNRMDALEARLSARPKAEPGPPRMRWTAAAFVGFVLAAGVLAETGHAWVAGAFAVLSFAAAMALGSCSLSSKATW